MYRPRRRFALFILAAGLIGPANAAFARGANGAAGAPQAGRTIEGPSRVTDGDTLRVGAIQVRLKGIAAPELDQPGGREAAATLGRMIGAAPVKCRPTGEQTWRREVGWCVLSAGTATFELNREMARLGWVASCPRYSRRYVAEEMLARNAGRGLWASDGAGYVLPGYCRAARPATGG